MPRPTFFRLPEEKRGRFVQAAIAEFSARSYAEASLSEMARQAHIPKGSVYQYFDDKLDLYRWLLTEEVPRRKREFLGVSRPAESFWPALEEWIERGMAFLVEHPELARLSAAAADPSASPEVRGLHRAVCEAGLGELRALLDGGLQRGAIGCPRRGLDAAVRFVAAIIGPGLTDVILAELGAELHDVLASDALRRRLDGRRRRRLARQAVSMIRSGLECRTTEEELHE